PGRGKTNGPDLSNVGRELTVRDIQQTLADPNSRIGAHTSSLCPGYAYCPDDTWAVVNVRLRSGSSLRGFARAQGKHDLQLQTLDGKLHLLKDSEYADVIHEKKSLMPPLSATAD